MSLPGFAISQQERIETTDKHDTMPKTAVRLRGAIKRRAYGP